MTFNSPYVIIVKKTKVVTKMPMPLSKEIREKIVYHKQQGAKNAEISKWLLVSIDSVKRIWKLYEKHSSVAPKPHKRGRKPAFCESVMNKLTAKVKEQPDITLAELIAEFRLTISISALSRKLIKEDLSFKKRRCFPKNNSAPTFSGFGESG